MAYKVTIDPQAGGRKVPLDAEQVAFVNSESYGKPENIGVLEEGKTLLVNLSAVAAVHIEAD